MGQQVPGLTLTEVTSPVEVVQGPEVGVASQTRGLMGFQQCWCLLLGTVE